LGAIPEVPGRLLISRVQSVDQRMRLGMGQCGISQKDGCACAFMDGPSVGMKQARGRTTLDTFRRKIDVSGSTVNGLGQAKTAGPAAVIFEGYWL
jgi:hypothetical protein